MKSGGRRFGAEKSLWFVVMVLLAAFFCGFWFKAAINWKPEETTLSQTQSKSLEANEQHNHLYVCPMMCVTPTKSPGKCPVCGMELFSVYVGGAEEGASRLELSSEAQQLAEIQLAAVERKRVAAEIRMYGNVEYDPGYLIKIAAFTNGIIDKVYVRRTGELVRTDHKLFDLYSADFFNAEQELIEAMRHVPNYLASQRGLGGNVPKATGQQQTATGDESIEAQQTFARIRFKMREWGLTEKDINDIMRLGYPRGIITVRVPPMGATGAGVVIENNVFPGLYVNTGTVLVTIADPRYVWARLEAYELDFPWLKFGQKVELEIVAYPGESFTGEVIDIAPNFDPKTHTFGVGVFLSDPERKLRPKMLVRARVLAELDADGKVVTPKTTIQQLPLVVPASAPLITGERAIVFVALADPRGAYEGREVVLGPRAGAYYVVKDGLKEGDMVVVNGNFKIDSSLQILARRSMMNVDADKHSTEGPAQSINPSDLESLSEQKGNHREHESTPQAMPSPKPE